MSDTPVLIISLREFADPRVAAALLALAQSLATDPSLLRAEANISDALRLLQERALSYASVAQRQAEHTVGSLPALCPLANVPFVLAATLDGLAKVLRAEIAANAADAWILLAERIITLRLLATEHSL